MNTNYKDISKNNGMEYYICFSKKKAIELREKGFNIIKTGINYKYPQKDIYYFAWTEELNNALILVGLPSRKDIVKKF